MYSRQITVYKGIDNVIEFRLLNADQKPIDVTGYEPRLVAFNDEGSAVIEHAGEVIDDSSAACRGVFTMTVSEQKLLDIPQQYLNYNIYLVDSFGNRMLTYSHSNFDNSASIFVSGDAFPGPRPTVEVTTFQVESHNSEVWYSEMAQVYPANNSVDRTHSVVVYSNGFTGDVVVQATLDNTTIDAVWSDVATVNFDGCETEPTHTALTGAFTFLRFKTTTDPEPIEKILVRT